MIKQSVISFLIMSSSTVLANDYIVDKFLFHDGPFDSLSEFHQSVPTMSANENTFFSYYNDALKSRLEEWNAIENPENKVNWIKALVRSVDKVLFFNLDPILPEPTGLDYQNMGFSELDEDEVQLLNAYIRDNKLRHMNFSGLIARVRNMTPLLRIQEKLQPVEQIEWVAYPLEKVTEIEDLPTEPIIEDSMDLAVVLDLDSELAGAVEKDERSRFALPPEPESEIQVDIEKVSSEPSLYKLRDASLSVDESENFTKILEDEKIEVIVEKAKKTQKIVQLAEKKSVNETPRKTNKSGGADGYCQTLLALGSSDTSGIDKDVVIANSGVTQGQFLDLKAKSMGYKVEASCFKRDLYPNVDFGLGLGFLKFGDFEGTYDITLTDLEQKKKIAESMWHPNTLFSLNFIPKYSFNNALNLHAKIGISYWSNKVKIGTDSFSKTGVLPNYGLGVTYAVMNQLGVSLDFDYVKYKSTGSSLISFGVVYEMDF